MTRTWKSSTAGWFRDVRTSPWLTEDFTGLHWGNAAPDWVADQLVLFKIAPLTRLRVKVTTGKKVPTILVFVLVMRDV